MPQSGRARAHTLSGGCSGGSSHAVPNRIAKLGVSSAPWDGASAPPPRDPLGGGSARPRPEAASRGEQIRGARLRRSSWCWAAEDVPHHPQTPRVSFPPAIERRRIPVRGAGSWRPCARARSLPISVSLSLSLQKLDLYRSRPRCHRRQTVMKSKENQLPDWRWGRDSASACARRRAARCNCCSQRAWGAGRRGSRV